MRKLKTLRALMALAAALFVYGIASPALAQGIGHAGMSDFALLDEPGGDVSVQCGALKNKGPTSVGPEDKPVAMVVYITMTNRTDLGGGAGFVRVTYTDGDFVDYAIPALGTLNITLAAGGTAEADSSIQVTDGGSDANLIGQISVFVQAKSGFGQHPDVSGGFCTTTAGP